MNEREPRTPGERVRAIRKARRLSQRTVASVAGMSQNLLSRIERDLVQPTVMKAQALAAALGATVEELWPLVTPAARASSSDRQRRSSHDEKVRRS